MKRTSLTIAAGLLLTLTTTACSKIPPEAYYNRGGPESLMDVSSERIHLDLQSDADLGELITWLNDDQPSAIELSCNDSSPLCANAIEIAEQFAVPIEYGTSPNDSVALIYNRIVTRDCNNTYVSDHINPYNLPHASFGCSMAVNTLQMISDKQQIASPALMDPQDGEKAGQAIDKYLTPTQSREFEDVFEFKGEGGG